MKKKHENMISRFNWEYQNEELRIEFILFYLFILFFTFNRRDSHDCATGGHPKRRVDDTKWKVGILENIQKLYSDLVSGLKSEHR